MRKTISAVRGRSRFPYGHAMLRCCSKRTSSALSIDGSDAMKPSSLLFTRREMLARSGMGMGMVALTSTLHTGGCLQAAELGGTVNALAPKTPPLPAKAKRVLHLFMNGGASHVDTFDPKPSLAKLAGKPIPITLKTERRTGAAFPSPFAFRKFGQSGAEISEVFSEVGSCADDLCIVRSMHTDIPNHEP